MIQQSELRRLRDFVEESARSDRDRLPPERELADALGLTRTRLRHGLKQLADEGLIWRHVGRGTYLGPRPKPAVRLGAVSEVTNPREIMEVRLIIEPDMARLAAFRSTARDYAEMVRCLDAMRSATAWSDWEQEDTRLHRAIAVAAHNELILALFETVANLKTIWGGLRPNPVMPASVAKSTREHEAIVQALRERDAATAQTLMREHLRDVVRTIFGDGT